MKRKRFALVAEGNHCSRLIFGLQSTAKIWAKFTSKHKSLNLPSTISKIVTFWSRNAIFFNFEDFKECYIILKFSYWNAHIGSTFPLKSTIFIVFLIILIYNLQIFKASSLQYLIISPQSTRIHLKMLYVSTAHIGSNCAEHKEGGWGWGGMEWLNCLDSRLLCLPVEQPGFPNCSLVRGNKTS